jgi:hypothetical protein
MFSCGVLYIAALLTSIDGSKAVCQKFKEIKKVTFLALCFLVGGDAADQVDFTKRVKISGTLLPVVSLN